MPLRGDNIPAYGSGVNRGSDAKEVYRDGHWGTEEGENDTETVL